MTVKTGQAWAGTFVTLDSTGALAAGSPAGALYVDGVANAAAVTITGSNPYKWAVTLPALTAGQRVDMYITATIATIATAGVVASEQADTVLVSDVKAETALILADTGTDGVKIASGELSTVATASSITALDGKIDTIDNFLDTEVAAILADTNELQAELADGGRTDLLIDAIKAKTDTIAAAPTAASVADAVWDEAIADHTSVGSFGAKNQKVVPSETINDYKADVSGLATSSALSAVDDLVDDLETRLTAARAGYLDKLNVTGTLAHSNDANTYKADVSGIPAAVWGYATRTLSSFGTLISDIWGFATRTLSAFGFTVATNSDANVTAIKAKTDNLPLSPAASGEYTAAIAAIPTNPLLATNYTAPDNTSIAAIKTKTDNLPASPAPANEYDTELAAIQADLDNPNQYKADVSALTNVTLSAAGVDAILDEVVVGSYTLRQLVKVMAAAMAGKATGGGTTTVTFRGVDDASDVIVATVDANGNRSAVTLTV